MLTAIWEQLDPGFLAPIWLLVGLIAAIALILLEIGSFRRRRQAVRMFAAAHLIPLLAASVSPFKRLLKAVLIVTGVVFVFVALARPHLLDNWQDEDRTGLDILLAVDCSKSMLTEDVQPNRLERAKLAIADFADELPDNRLGLIAFAGDAFLQCPLTLDHDAFQTAVRELDTDTIPRPGTDIATAIDEAVDALKSQPTNQKFLILISDGEDLEGRAVEAAQNAAQAGLRIYTVGVGTPAGDVIPEHDEYNAVRNHRDANGQIVISKLDENSMRQIAALTGGAYVPLGQRGEGLEQIFKQDIATLPKQNLEERRQRIRLERFEWPLTLGILCLMCEFIINDRTGTGPSASPPIPGASAGTPRRTSRRRSRPEAATTLRALLSLLVFVIALQPARAGDIGKAESDYKAGKYSDAMQSYEKAAEATPDRSDLQFNRGDAAYKAGEYSEAEEAYGRALETPDLSLQEKTYYNLGNTQFMHGAAMKIVDVNKTIHLWEKAVHSYDSALKLHTTADALHNYQYVKKKLEELKKMQQQSGQGQPSNSSGGSGDQQSSGGSSGGNSSDPSGQQASPGGNSSQDQDGDSDPSKNSPANDGNRSQSKNGISSPAQAYSGTRAKDLQDPNIRSRQDAENLLDSLKDDEHHVTARLLNGDSNQPPPTSSGKDW